MKFICIKCKKEFNAKPSSGRKFCSIECFRQTPISKETRKKMSNRLKSNPINYWKGKKQPKEMCDKKAKKMIGNKHLLGKRWTLTISRRKQISESRMGKNSFFWKGGLTEKNNKIRHSFEAKLWKESVFKRDDYTCQATGQRGGKLEVHHIQNFAEFPELRTSIENGITLAQKVHRKFHSKYGRKNNNQKQLHEFLTEYYN